MNDTRAHYSATVTPGWQCLRVLHEFTDAEGTRLEVQLGESEDGALRVRIATDRTVKGLHHHWDITLSIQAWLSLSGWLIDYPEPSPLAAFARSDINQ